MSDRVAICSDLASLGGEVEEVTTTRTVVRRSPRGPAILLTAAVFSAATASGAAMGRAWQRHQRKRSVLCLALHTADLRDLVSQLEKRNTILGNRSSKSGGLFPAANRSDCNDLSGDPEGALLEAWLLSSAAAKAGDSAPLIIHSRCRR